MKHIITAAFCALYMSVAAFGQVNLFENRNLADWDFHTDKTSTAVSDVYSFSDDGVLSCTGQPMGWLGTKAEYKNFHLSVEYRWKPGSEPSNTGIFIRLNNQPKDSFLPRCYEIQLCHGKNGFIMGLHDMKIPPTDVDKDRYTEKTLGNTNIRINGLTHKLDAEKKPGEWNALEILCVEKTIAVILNGKLVNWTTSADVLPGKIAFQSEGGPCEFRNAVLNTGKF
jgi:hypothetical protein